MRIEDYGFLSDTETACLVGRDGSIDWLCMPRFDSPACFASLLGGEENGFWRIAPKNDVKATRRAYRDGTLILETEFETDEGCVRLIDLMPIRDERPDVIRIVEGVRGSVEMTMRLVIRFDYGEIVPWVQRHDGGIVATAGPDAFILRSDVKTHAERLSTIAEFTVAKGERKAFVLTWFPSHLPPPAVSKSEHSLDETEAFWREWSGHCHSKSPWKDAVSSSLLVLKGLTYAPTGGVLAAATAGLPEKVGGVRNWDYRYCWLRDATFTLYALLNAGYTEEAAAWRDWLLRAIAGSPAQMQILYGVAGERRLLEYELPNLAGYEGSKPVRVGNAASGQFQLDVYGEVIDAMHQARRVGIASEPASWNLQRHLIEFVAKHWTDPDEGIWEVRGPRRHFTHSKMMAWVAMDRAAKACEKHGLKGDAPRWRCVRDEIHREVCARGFSSRRGAFVQSFECDRLDASLLMMPLVGFLPASDPRVRSTIEAIQRDLMVDGFVLRYHPDESENVDGLPPGEGAFLPCSFWLVDCLNMIGQRSQALDLFGNLLDLRNDLGLLSEEYDPAARRLVGNFPQAFTHVGLVNSASNLARDRAPASHRCEDPNA
jgi:GH15 family glucan-1,4-alpha-glucosidase